MKVMFASDIHGSLYWTKKLLDAFDREGAARLFLLGDLLYHGPRNRLPRDYDPQGVYTMLNERKQQIMCVRGNCDAEVDQVVLDFPILADCTTIMNEGRTIFLTHGHHESVDNLPSLGLGDCFMQGHTHVPMHEYRNGIFCLNPGSVSLPKMLSPHSYMTLENEKFHLKTMDGEDVWVEGQPTR